MSKPVTCNFEIAYSSEAELDAWPLLTGHHVRHLGQQERVERLEPDLLGLTASDLSRQQPQLFRLHKDEVGLVPC